MTLPVLEVFQSQVKIQVASSIYVLSIYQNAMEEVQVHLVRGPSLGFWPEHPLGSSGCTLLKYRLCTLALPATAGKSSLVYECTNIVSVSYLQAERTFVRRHVSLNTQKQENGPCKCRDEIVFSSPQVVLTSWPNDLSGLQAH